MKFFVDNNISPRVAKALNALLEPQSSAVHLRERFEASTHDTVWMPALASEHDWFIISGDIRISRNPLEVEAWLKAGHIIFFLKPGWTNIQPWEQSAKLFHRFPEILKLCKKSKKGSGYLVPLKSGKITSISKTLGRK